MKSAAFLKRFPDSHKGHYGRVLIVAGSRGMSGAASLSAIGALRSGAGLVTLVVPDSIYTVVARRDPEIMVHSVSATSSGSIHFKSFKKITTLLAKQDVLAIGPGLGRDPLTAKLVHRLIASSKIPVVIDADALNAIAETPRVLLGAVAPLILTPHEGEFRRVFGGFENRKKNAQEAAEKYGVYIALKGHRTIVAHPNGKTFVNKTGNPGMAKAGSGDVLTGMIAGLLGRGKDIYETVCLAVHAHGMAGDFAAKKTGQTSMLARDILEALPAVFKKLGNK